MTVPSASTPLARARPGAVTGAFCGAVAAAGLAGMLVVVSDRALGYLGLGAAVSAVTALAAAFPMRAGRPRARLALMLSALFGALCAPAAANAVDSSTAPILGGVLVAGWAAVVCLLLRADARDFFGTPVTPVSKAEA
ncbi:hypothetical protein [Actinokineospora sp.]|uniref:hypothetical protein n=1 Tax=Actinokineospora sp. TaxID=1872133 RepID=UPI004037B33A